MINAAGIFAIHISNTTGGIEVDHLHFGIAARAPPPPVASIPVPLFGPAGLALLALLLGAAGIVRSRRR